MAPNTMSDDEKIAKHVASIRLAAKDAITLTDEEFRAHLQALQREANQPLPTHRIYAQPSLLVPAQPLVDEDTDDVFPGNMINSFMKDHGIEKAVYMCSRPPMPVKEQKLSEVEVELQAYTDRWKDGNDNWKTGNLEEAGGLSEDEFDDLRKRTGQYPACYGTSPDDKVREIMKMQFNSWSRNQRPGIDVVALPDKNAPSNSSHEHDDTAPRSPAPETNQGEYEPKAASPDSIIGGTGQTTKSQRSTQEESQRATESPEPQEKAKKKQKAKPEPKRVPTTTKLTPAQRKKRAATQKRAQQAGKQQAAAIAAAYSQTKPQLQADPSIESMNAIANFSDDSLNLSSVTGLGPGRAASTQGTGNDDEGTDHFEFDESVPEEARDTLRRLFLNMQKRQAELYASQHSEEMEGAMREQEEVYRQQQYQKREPRERGHVLGKICEEDDEDGDDDGSTAEPNTPSDSDDNMLGTPRITRKVPPPDTPAKSMFKKAKDAKDADKEEK